MSVENGSLSIVFTKEKSDLPGLTKLIAERLSSLEKTGLYWKDEVCEWSFLEGWDAERFELSSQLVTYDSIDCVKAFVKEIIATFPELGFGGSLYHDWVSSESSPTQITFMHKKDTRTLLWQSKWWSPDALMDALDSECEPDRWSGNIEDLPATQINHWIWDAKTNKSKKLTTDADLNYYAEFLMQR